MHPVPPRMQVVSVFFMVRLCLALVAISSLRADVIYTNFGAGDAYSAGTGLIVTNDGKAWSSAAIAFIPEANYVLTSIEFAATDLFLSGSGATLALFGDESGHPGGKPIESFEIERVGSFGDFAPVLSVKSALSPLLQANTVYWVGLNAPEGGLIVWNQNSILAFGFSATDGAGNWSVVDGAQGVLEIDGTLAPDEPVITPVAPLVIETGHSSAASAPQEEIPAVVSEPGSWSMIAGAAIALALSFRRQNRARFADQK